MRNTTLTRFKRSVRFIFRTLLTQYIELAGPLQSITGAWPGPKLASTAGVPSYISPRTIGIRFDPKCKRANPTLLQQHLPPASTGSRSTQRDLALSPDPSESIAKLAPPNADTGSTSTWRQSRPAGHPAGPEPRSDAATAGPHSSSVNTGATSTIGNSCDKYTCPSRHWYKLHGGLFTNLGQPGIAKNRNDRGNG